MSNIIPIFPIPIKVCKKYIFNKEELNLLLNKENINKNIGNNFSSNNKRILDNNILQNLKNFFISEIENYAYQTLQIKQDIFFHITQSWTNFNEKNTYHHKHNHSNSIFSAVCFLDVSLCLLNQGIGVDLGAGSRYLIPISFKAPTAV